jgi:hypothetical protein
MKLIRLFIFCNAANFLSATPPQRSEFFAGWRTVELLDPSPQIGSRAPGLKWFARPAHISARRCEKHSPSKQSRNDDNQLAHLDHVWEA